MYLYEWLSLVPVYVGLCANSNRLKLETAQNGRQETKNLEWDWKFLDYITFGCACVAGLAVGICLQKKSPLL